MTAPLLPELIALERIIEQGTTDGVTVLLVSHAMEEIEQLCDRIALLDGGRVIALDTPAAVVAQSGAPTLDDAFVALTGKELEVSE